MQTNGHYTVKRGRGFAAGDGMGDIELLLCRHCDFRVDVRRLRRIGDRSGLPRYNRARAVMVKHLHEEHSAALSEPVTD